MLRDCLSNLRFVRRIVRNVVDCCLLRVLVEKDWPCFYDQFGIQSNCSTFFKRIFRGHALSTYAKRGRGGVLPLRTPLHKCDVTYVVSPAYKGGEGVKKS